MHILYILDFYKPNIGGIEVLLDEIINHFWKNNKVSVITWNFNWKLPEIEKKWNITIYRVKSTILQTYPFSAYKKWKEIISDVDIIHANNFYSAFVWSKLAKKYGKKAILHIHWYFWVLWFNMLEWNYFVKKLKEYKFRFLEKMWINWNFDKYLCVSKYIYDVCKFYYNVDDKKLELLYNGLDYEKWENTIDNLKVENIKKKYSLDNVFSLLFVWRIEKVKWWDVFLEVLKLLDFDTKVLFIIHWNLDKFIWKIYSLWAKKIKENEFLLNKSNIIIVWPKKHNEIWNYIKSVSWTVFSSITESFWYFGLETSILNVPIIASNNGAIPEVVFWKVNFFDIWDKNSFVKAIKNTKNWIYENIPFKNFDLKLLFSKLENIYKKVLKWE